MNTTSAIEPSTTVVVADDDPDIRELLATLLSEAGFCVHAAANGHAALRYLVGRPDVRLLVTDIVMPEMEGIELIRETRRRCPGVRIIAMTGGAPGSGFATYLEMARSLGADDALTKPFAGAEILSKIESLLTAASPSP
jgi:CheY-like chemotaxis protein